MERESQLGCSPFKRGRCSLALVAIDAPCKPPNERQRSAMPPNSKGRQKGEEKEAVAHQPSFERRPPRQRHHRRCPLQSSVAAAFISSSSRQHVRQAKSPGFLRPGSCVFLFRSFSLVSGAKIWIPISRSYICSTEPFPSPPFDVFCLSVLENGVPEME